MLVPVRSLLAALNLAACTAPATVTPEPAPTPAPTTNLSKPVDPTPAPTTDPIQPATQSPPIAVTSLTGYVSAQESSGDLPAQLTARVTELDTSVAGIWRIVLSDGTNSHWLKIQVPAALPPPLRVDEQVRAVLSGSGGGPNYFLTMIFTTLTGDLLLAVNAVPDGWQIAQGKQISSDRGSDYTERHYGVNFTHAGVTVVGTGGWARMDVGGAAYYVWGSAARRKLRVGKRPMPDYVGSWLDSAIVRAR